MTERVFIPDAMFYDQFVAERFKPFPTDIENILHAAIGIAGEAGELLDAVKKTWAYGKPLDTENILEELGDLEFYLQAMRLQLGFSRPRIIKANMEKLFLRYPKGYSDQAALARADKAGG